MSDRKIVVKSRTGFTSVPNHFIQCKSLSIESKGVATFLQSLPPGWNIHPEWVQSELGFGERVWRRVAKELIEHGCLKMYKGGHDRGCYYTFDLWNYEENFINSIPENDKTSPSGNSRERQNVRADKMSPLNNKLAITNKKTNNNNPKKVKTAKEVDMDYLDNDVVSFWIEKLKGYGISEKRARGLLTYGYGRIQEKIDLLESNPREIANPAGWLMSAIENDYKLPTPKKPTSKRREVDEVERKALLEKLKQVEEQASKPESREAGVKHLSDLKKRFRVAN